MIRQVHDVEDLAVNEPEQRLAARGDTLERFSVVVVGGGQAGLAAGYDLAQRGIDFVILERESRLGENWRPHWDSLRLFTQAPFEGLPGLPFQSKQGTCITKDEVSEYLERYAERFGLPVRTGIDVLGLTADERGHLVVEWDHGSLIAGEVIVASDLHVPPRKSTHRGDRRMIRLRPGDYRTLSQLSQGGELVVVGASSTGLPPRAFQGMLGEGS